MNTPNWILACLLAAANAGSASAEPTIGSTEYLGPFTGEGAAVHPDNLSPHRIEYYGTDLGFSYEHGGMLQFLFGDTWATEASAPIEASTGARFDDGFGTVDLRRWSDPRQLARDRIPPIRLVQNPGTTEMSAIDPGHVMDPGKTPMGGFSNGTREFGIFNIGKPQGCLSDADCGDGLTCDATLGYIGPRYSEEENFTFPCRDGNPGCNADTMADAAGAPVPGSGFCADETSMVGREPVSNLLTTMGFRVRIGVRDASDPRKYGATRDWLTNKFMNVTVRTVEGFIAPTRAGKLKQDYRPAKGTGDKRRVFLWGRPGFVGVAANSRTLGVYFAYVDIPTGPGFAWNVNYYAGTADGMPQFSPDQKDAAPLDLDSTRVGVQPEEMHDIVNQLSVAWIGPLNKWVMFYGGGLGYSPRTGLPTCGVTELFVGAACRNVIVGNGAIRMRTADDPWGPWTPPQDVIVGGDPADGPKNQYGPGGALRHAACVDPVCAPHSDTAFFTQDEYGFFYSANIIEQWIRPVRGGADLIWNASTWDPYRVILLRTRIRK
ncbi:MAG: DUF4185 domain-containing protein [Gammaproteobacteria bacterium]|nr:DUF4185 domain-containing protein [Gammaproteobacteria bacterium]